MYDQDGFYSDNLPHGGPGGAGPHGGDQDVNFNFDGFDFGGGSGAAGGGASFRDLFSQFFSGGRGGAGGGAGATTPRAPGNTPPKAFSWVAAGAAAKESPTRPWPMSQCHTPP